MPTKRSISFLVFVLAIIFYGYTLLPSLAWGDGTKLQSEAIAGESFLLAQMTSAEFSPDPYIFAKVGVAAWDHPLYIVIGHTLVQTLSSVDALWLINFLSSLFGAASVALVFQLCYRFTCSLPASLYASFSLAVSHTFWWHSSTPEVYTLFTFLLLISFYLFDHFQRTGRYPALLGSAYSLGLAAANHVLAFLAMPALALDHLLSKGFRCPDLPEIRDLVLLPFGFLVGFSLFLIQFARMARNFPLNEIMGPVVGTTFLGRLGSLNPIVFGESLLTYLLFLTLQFSPIGLILGALGLRSILRSADLYLRKIVAFFGVYAMFGVLYRVSDQFAFFLTSYVFWAIMMGIGAKQLFFILSGKTRLFLASILALIILGTPLMYNAVPGLVRKASLSDASIGIPQIGTGVRDGLAYYLNPNKRGDFSAYQFGSQTLAYLPPHSVVIAEWYTDTDEYFVLRYFTDVQRLRPDVSIVGWPTQDPFTFDSRLVLKVIEDSLPLHPVFLASLSDQFYAASKLMEKYCIVPEDNLYRLYPGGFYGYESEEIQCIKPISE